MGTRIKWGILGCANIARKNAAAIYDSPECELAGIASRSEARAEEFRKDCGLPDSVICYGSYDDLLQEEWIDAVYVPLPTALHLEWVLKAFKHKKHVLVEKPLAIDVETLELMREAAKQSGCLLMDGVMFVHSLRTEKLREILQPMRFGEVELVESKFSFRGDDSFFRDNIRCSPEGDPLGCLGDLGWYSIRLSLIAFRCNEAEGGEMQPGSVSAVCHEWKNGVPMDLSATIYFDGPGGSRARRRATFHCSFIHGFDQYCRISSRANRPGILDHKISMNDFVIPRHPASASFELESFGGAFEDVASRVMSNVESYTTGHCQQEERMFSFFSAAIKEMSIAGSLTHSLEQFERINQDADMTMVLCERLLESAKNNGEEVAF